MCRLSEDYDDSLCYERVVQVALEPQQHKSNRITPSLA